MKAVAFFRNHRKSTYVLSIGNLVSALLLLIRNILIARLVSVEDFGIASSLAIAVTLIETSTNLALDRMIVQDRRGGQRRFIASLHSIQILRGIVGAMITLAFAQTYASVLGLSEHVWAYQCLAAIPLMRAFCSLAVYRLQRVLQFGPLVAVTVVSNGVALLTALPLGLWLGDFRAMLAVIMLQHLIFVIGSHVASRSRYRVEWNKKILRDSLGFGAPLLINGFVIFATLNGDQVLIGSYLGMEALAQFAVAFALTLVPATVLANTLQSLMLPGLARSRSDPRAFQLATLATLRIAFAAAALLTILLSLIGPPAIELLFGARYDLAAALLPWLAVLQGVRIAKAGPAILAIASADTLDPLIANLARLACLPVAVIWLANGANILSVVSVAVLGEVLALLVSIGLLVRRGNLTVSGFVRVPGHG